MLTLFISLNELINFSFQIAVVRETEKPPGINGFDYLRGGSVFCSPHFDTLITVILECC